MAQGKFISYLRVSTAKQGASGLGLEAQRKAVADYLNGGSWTVITELVEVESGKRNDRPKLDEALRLCRIHGATLVIAKLDRLSRDAAFLMKLQNEGVRFVAADMPEANEMIVGIMAVVAQAERKMISTRTKAALSAKKEFYAKLTDAEREVLKASGKAISLGGDRGVIPTTAAQNKGGAATKAKAIANAADRLPIIAEIQATGITSASGIASALNERGIPTANGGRWQAVQVQRVLTRAA
ncbi:recombinase family protein [Methylobacterium sp. 37f]|uniref:recombinase family protein n=1 Tax=Methylobacterium sp. 37f TaxID=2817058 RepID=UPI001FFCADF1|nr:recombinase family protein [Methylobacterium sp. 37f]MCK2056986.1 recombinase family protein [Methylobacterium sp. 37f]